MLASIKKMIKQMWIKKIVSKTEWNSWYSKNSSYCYLYGKGSEIWVGFLVAGEVPEGCFALDNEELRQVDEYRRAKNISPYPLLSKTEKPKQKISKTTSDALNKIKETFRGKRELIGNIPEPLVPELTKVEPEEPKYTEEEEAKRQVILKNIPF